MSELVCHTCGAKIDSAGQRPATCPTCHAPLPAADTPIQAQPEEPGELVAPLPGQSRGLFVVVALIGLLLIAGAAGLFWYLSWSATTPGPVATTIPPAGARKPEPPTTVGPAKKATEKLPPTPLVVRAVVEGDTDEAGRKDLAQKLVDFLATIGISSDPDVKEPVVRLRAAGPFMTEIAQRSAFKKVTGSPIKGAVCVAAYLDVLNAKGIDIVGRVHALPKADIECYVIVKDERVDYQKDKPETYPDAIKEVWQKLPETVAKSIYKNQESHPERLYEVLKEGQPK
jgi:hypothetical protein